MPDSSRDGDDLTRFGGRALVVDFEYRSLGEHGVDLVLVVRVLASLLARTGAEQPERQRLPC